MFCKLFILQPTFPSPWTLPPEAIATLGCPSHSQLHPHPCSRLCLGLRRNLTLTNFLNKILYRFLIIHLNKQTTTQLTVVLNTVPLDHQLALCHYRSVKREQGADLDVWPDVQPVPNDCSLVQSWLTGSVLRWTSSTGLLHK